MKKKELFLGAALAGLMIAGPTSASKNAKTMEKCKGVAAKGANSCGAKDHGCGGFAKTNYDPKEWVYVKKGTCKKIQAALKDKDLQEFLEKSTENARVYKKNFKG